MKLIECPRDAMQGIHTFIPTEKKVHYINSLLEVGFDTLDFGSFVSPKAIPQLRDTVEVLSQLKVSDTKLLAIVANTRGAEEASQHDRITYLGFPLSISETFQQRNTNKSIAEALNTLDEIQQICLQSNKVLVTYISMGFGNPYGDLYSVDHVLKITDVLATMGVAIVSLADTIGVSQPEQIENLYSLAVKNFPSIEFGAHLHSSSQKAWEKIAAAYQAGCQRFDGALKGFGGCPMAEDELVGNLATETILSFLDSKQAAPDLNRDAFSEAMKIADDVFSYK
ncbi:MAG: hydroxymethylglutaryl-CoA lyase [Chryseotalea sp. WA131a]|nr:MAG: hydroxymethylglutaryl-CoA lyase [Chryseotalea sp. WA131a]